MTNKTNNKARWLQVVLSVCAAAFGVQNQQNHNRDFKSNSIWPFILAGLLFTAVFIIAVTLVVNLVLP